MARRVSWTNNSSGHTGTYVYRAPTLDPQNLPSPVATIDPVAQGVTTEWIDSTATDSQCYAVQDFDGGGVGTLSDEACVTVLTPGELYGGGRYVGDITYQDGRTFMLITALDDGDFAGQAWRTSTGLIAGADSDDDGWQNTQDMLAAGNSPAATACTGYGGGGNSDWYVPAANELLVVAGYAINNPSQFIEEYFNRFSSTEIDSNNAKAMAFDDTAMGIRTKTATFQSRVRAVRRIAI